MVNGGDVRAEVSTTVGSTPTQDMPAPPLLPGRVLVRRVHSFVPDGFFSNPSRWRGDAWLARLRRRYPRPLTKAVAYLRAEGLAQTLTKARTRVALERLDSARAAFAAVGVIVDAPDTRFSAGAPVLCWSWQGPIDAEFHLVAPLQCLPVPRVSPEFALAPFLGWIADVVRGIDERIQAFDLCGLDQAFSDPLTRLLGTRLATGGPCARIGYGPRLPSSRGPNTFSIRLSAERAVGPLVASEPAGTVCRLPDPAHYFLDPHYPGEVEFPWPFSRATVEEAIGILTSATGRRPRSSVAISTSPPERVLRLPARGGPAHGSRGVSCLGAGNYVRAVLLHHLRRCQPITVRGVMDIRPEVAAMQGRALQADFCTTAPEAVFEDDGTDLVLIASDHASHADYAIAALRAGKAVHLEKPPAVTPGQLTRLLHCLHSTTNARLHLGYNRPFAPATIELQSRLAVLTGPTSITCRVRGYRLSRAHWYRWPNQGTRIAGNVVHWIDLGYRLTGRRRPTAVEVELRDGPSPDGDALQLTISFEDGSAATIHFDSGGDPVDGLQEVIEVRKEELNARIDDFRALSIDDHGGHVRRTYPRDKGHAANMAALAALTPDEGRQARTMRDLEVTGAIQFAAERALVAGGGRIELDALRDGETDR
jgi:predicted dehydrogenase